MSLYGLLRTGASGMTAQSNRLGTIGDNIANADTTGYKRASAQFSALLLENGGTQYNSGAVSTTIRTAVSEQGPTMFTTSPSDLMINGNGFFVVSDASGNNYLTRAGNFVKDGTTGDYVNAAGYTLTGYDLSSGDAAVVNGYSGLKPVNLDGFSMTANPTTEGTFAANLPQDAEVGATYESSVQVYDNLGGQQILTFSFEKTGDGTWDMTVDPAGSTAVPVELTFDLTTGELTGGGPTLSLTGLGTADGFPSDQSIDFDITGMTQLDAKYTAAATADGNMASAVSGIEFSADGIAYAIYDDGSKLAAFRVPVATVASPDNLEQLAGSAFATTLGSGEVQLGTAGLDGRGFIGAGALEQSNVDLGSELTEMIISQRSYTANSKVFQTGSELLEVLMNLKR